MQETGCDVPELDESLMQEQGHEVPRHVIAFSRQE
jgi:hypothetical protein